MTELRKSLTVDGISFPPWFSVERIYKAFAFKPSDSDIIISSYPKSGTHWMCSLLKTIYNLKGITVDPPVLLEAIGDLQPLSPSANGRIIFTHLPLGRLNFSPTSKLIHIFRNPKDCCVSFYNHVKKIQLYGFQNGQFNNFFDAFIYGRVDYGFYFNYENEWFCDSSMLQNVFFVSYEELQRDFLQQIALLCDFLLIKLTHDEIISVQNCCSLSSTRNEIANDLDRLLETTKSTSFISKGTDAAQTLDALRFDPEAKRSYVEAFARKGIVGDWRNWMNKNQSDVIDALWRNSQHIYPATQHIWSECMQWPAE